MERHTVAPEVGVLRTEPLAVRRTAREPVLRRVLALAAADHRAVRMGREEAERRTAAEEPAVGGNSRSGVLVEGDMVSAPEEEDIGREEVVGNSPVRRPGALPTVSSVDMMQCEP